MNTSEIWVRPESWRTAKSGGSRSVFVSPLFRRNALTGKNTLNCSTSKGRTIGIGRDLNGQEPWACSNCDCTDRLEQRMRSWGRAFGTVLDEVESARDEKSDGRASDPREDKP